MTTSSDANIADALAAEFPPEAIKQVQKGRATLDYVPVSEVVTRLNNVLGLDGWQIVESEVWRDKLDTDWIIAKVTIEAEIDGRLKKRTGWGGQKIKMLNSGDGPVDLGDEFKGAASDALKKAASLLGVALHLSRDEEMIAFEEQQRLEAERATEEQLDEIRAFASNLSGEDEEEFKDWWKKNVGRRINSGRVTKDQYQRWAERYTKTDEPSE